MNLLDKKGLVICHLPRRDEAVLYHCGVIGVATLHEAWDCQGLMGPAIRPIQQGISRVGDAVTVLVTPGDNWMFHVMVKQCRADDTLVVTPTSPYDDGSFGDLLATFLQPRGVVGLMGNIGIRGSQTLREMGFAVWSRQVYAQGTVKESLGSVNVLVIYADQLVQPDDVVVTNDDGVVMLPHAQVRDVLGKAEARMSNELTKRGRMRHGGLGLDVHVMRPRLAEKRLRYYDRTDEMEEQMAQRGIPCLQMHGGTSKVTCFSVDDLPADPVQRDAVLLVVMDSPDPRQIDRVGGADPLTSKVAIIRRSTRPGADVDYLSAQVSVVVATVDYGQNRGSIFATVSPFAIERGLVCHDAPLIQVRIYMENTG